MNRKEFIGKCGWSCVGAFVTPALLLRCAGTKYVSAPIEGSELVVPISSFEIKKEGTVHFRKYLVVENELLQFPIYVSRENETAYRALWMQCTHQGAELHPYGEVLQCPAHGSEFGSDGEVANGPASVSLRSFVTVVEEGNLKITLR